MCGIVGARRFDGGTVDGELLRHMTDQLQHRGPDATGVWWAGPVGLGNRRLSIIDLAGSPQPMASVGNACHVTFNGEIFNYRALRQSLTYPFRTQGDTEVLLALFLDNGWRGVEQLDGQFAYAIFDQRDESLWLFRDRLGILPLYYYQDNDVFLFASEIKALLPLLPQTPSVDEDCLDDYLAHRVVPAPKTLFKGVRKLPQGHYLHLSRNGRLEISPYWSIPPDPGSDHPSDGEAIARVAEALERAVEKAMVADVPVGAYLSGGVDSSLIVALMAKRTDPGAIHTFSAGFGDARFDEIPFARQVSQLLGTQHHEVVVGPDDFQTLWQRLTWHRDAPLSEPADVAVFRLAALAREHVKVCLSGEGSDELFGGYPKHRFGPLAARSGVVPAPVRKAILGIGQKLMPARASRLRTALRAIGASSDGEWLRAWFSPFTEDERLELLGWTSNAKEASPFASAVSGDVLHRMLYYDCHTWLADNLLERGDRMSMAASVELRPPFLDHHLVELAFSLPSRVKVRNGETKWVLKQIARRHLPRELVDRRKVGFRVPLDVWFRGHLRDMAWDVLLSRQAFVGQVMDRGAIRSLLESHGRARGNEEIRIWTLLCLEIWHDVFLKRAVQSSWTQGPAESPSHPRALVLEAAPGAAETRGRA